MVGAVMMTWTMMMMVVAAFEKALKWSGRVWRGVLGGWKTRKSILVHPFFLRLVEVVCAEDKALSRKHDQRMVLLFNDT